MNRALRALPVLFLLASASGLQATSVTSITGTFQQDDDTATILFTLNVDEDVTIRTWSYAGGVDALGDTIPPGGFDPILSVFDITGLLIALNDNGDANVPADPATGNHWDSFLPFVSLPAGTYTLVLTEADNFPNGPTLADGFSQAGQGNFTGPETGNPGGSFFDISGSQRTNAWEVDVIGADSASQVVPEPRTVIPLGMLLAFVIVRELRRVHPASRLGAIFRKRSVVVIQLSSRQVCRH